jgi:hypothetical protein
MPSAEPRRRATAGHKLDVSRGQSAKACHSIVLNLLLTCSQLYTHMVPCPTLISCATTFGFAAWFDARLHKTGQRMNAVHVDPA